MFATLVRVSSVAVIIAVSIACAGANASIASDGSTRGVLTLVHQGAARAVVIIPEEPSTDELIASGEFRTYVKKATGVWLDVFQDSEVASGGSLDQSSSEGSLSEMVQIHIGRTRQAVEALGLSDGGSLFENEQSSGEGFVIRSIGNRIFCMGESDIGTRFAIYEFLRRFLGVRWFMPTELFEYVPKHDTVNVALPLNIYEQPGYSPRVFGYVWHGINCSYVGKQDVQYGCDIWATRNLLTVDGRGRPGDYSHNLFRIIVPSKYGKAHPEYFPLINGRRYVPASDGDQNWQPCLSNPDVVELAVKAARDFFERNPNRDTFSLGINDGFGWCECPNCKAMDTHPRVFRGRQVMSERYFTFVNRVAREVAKTHPDKWIGVIAYLNVELPPEGMTLEPNVKVYITQDTSQYHDESYLRDDCDMLARWARSARFIGKYDYYGLTWIMPRYFPHILARDLKEARTLGVKAYYVEDVPTWATMGPMLYVASRLMWDPEEDVDQLIEEFCQGLFCEAAEPMREYFATLERAWLTPRSGRWFEGLGNVIPQVNLFPQSVVDACDVCLARARGLAQDELTRERIEFFERGWRLCKMYAEENELMNAIKAIKPRAEEDVRGLAARITELEGRRKERLEYLKEVENDGLLGGTIRWMAEDLGRIANWEHQVDVALSYATNLIIRYYEEAASNAGDPEGFWRDVITKHPGTPIEESGRDQLFLLTRGNQIVNLLKDPGFEDGPIGRGMPPGWSTWSAEPGVRFVWDSSTARTGRASVKIQGAKKDACFIQKIPIEQGKRYFVRAFARTDSRDRSGTLIRVRWQDKSGRWIHEERDVIIPLGDIGDPDAWHELSAGFIPPADAAYCIVLLLARSHESMTTSSWFDDVAVYEISR